MRSSLGSQIAYPYNKATLRPQDEHETLESARGREAQPTFKQDYQQRAGIAGTISAGV